jgi:RNA polymerase sigma-70 factor (ECF subfamily)
MTNAAATVPSPDLFLARRASRADPRAWDELVGRYGERIFQLAWRFAGSREEAEDLTQEVFLKLYQNLHRYRGDVPLVGWALRLSRNLCIDHYRHQRARRQAETLPAEALERLPGGDDPGRRSRAREDRRMVHRALAEMSEVQATVVMLCDLQGLSYEEVAGFLEVPVGTVKSRLHRARRELSERLEEILGLTAAEGGEATSTKSSEKRSSS